MGKIKTPIEIRIPFDEVEDNGLILVHDIGGDPRNFLHSIYVPDNHSDAIQYLRNACYQKNVGFLRDGKKWWEYIKPFPLGISSWAKTNVDDINDEIH